MKLATMLGDAPVDSGSAAFGGAVSAAVIGILAIVFRFSNTRDAAKDAASREHIATLKEDNAAKAIELAALRVGHDTLIERFGHVTGERDALARQHETMLDTSERQRLQLDAMLADVTLLRKFDADKATQIEEQVATIGHLQALLDTHNVPWRK